MRWKTVPIKDRISIHAPPRGATGDELAGGVHALDFNSRPSARGDSFRFCVRMAVAYFNSRPSARGDLDKLL